MLITFPFVNMSVRPLLSIASLCGSGVSVHISIKQIS